MFQSGLRFLITSLSVLIILVISTHPTIISYLYHAQGLIPSIGFRLLSLFLSIVLVMAFHGIGLLTCQLIGFKMFPKNMEFPTRFFIGFLLASAAVYFLGFSGMLHKEIFFTVVLFGVCISIYKIITITSKNYFQLNTLKKETGGKLVITCVGFFLLARMFPILNFNSFGDPLFYNLPVGRDYLEAGVFQWIEQAEYYWQAGLSEIGLIYLHSLTYHPMLVQLTAQAFYYLTGTLFLLLILHKGLFSKLIPEKHSLWIAFSFIAMDTFRFESIVAKSDYWLAVLLCLIIVFLYEILTEETPEIRLQLLKILMLFCGLCLSIKTTSILFLIPVCIGILIFGSHIIPWKSTSFWGFFVVALVLGLLNSAKNYYIFESPIIPFASDIFHSQYWDQEGLKGIRELSTMDKGDFADFPHALFKIFVGHPVSLLLVLIALIWRKNSLIIMKCPAPQIELQKIISLSWCIGLILWLTLFDPLVNTRYIIGFVFLTLILTVIFATQHLVTIFHQNHQKLQNYVGGIALLLTLSVSHIDVDLHQARHWISSKSLHEHWLTSSSLAEVQNYLNKNVNPKTRVLFHYTTQRFHANFVVYGARTFSPRTRFVYSKDKNEIKDGLNRIKPEYYVIRKSETRTSGGLLEKKSFLDENFTLLMNFKEFLLYKIPKDFGKY